MKVTRESWFRPNGVRTLSSVHGGYAHCTVRNISQQSLRHAFSSIFHVQARVLFSLASLEALRGVSQSEASRHFNNGALLVSPTEIILPSSMPQCYPRLFNSSTRTMMSTGAELARAASLFPINWAMVWRMSVFLNLKPNVSKIWHTEFTYGLNEPINCLYVPRTVLGKAKYVETNHCVFIGRCARRS